MKINAPKNANYAATVIKIEKLVPLANCKNVQHAIIMNNAVVVGNDVKLGDVGVFFVLESKLSNELLSNNNLYHNAELNKDKTKKGFFDSGRVRCQKFRSNKSEGFYLPLSSLDFINKLPELNVGDTFDELNGVPICEKYVVAANKNNENTSQLKKKKTIKRISRLIEGQFTFHADTLNGRKNIHLIGPENYISITQKWHGTSGVFARVLVKRKLSFIDRVCKFFGAKVVEEEMGYIRSSRRVIKDAYLDDPKNKNKGFYGYDLWEDVAKEINSSLEDGISLYVEICGYTREGKAIQQNYHYGCEKGKYKIVVYRITSTNVGGKTIELSHNQMKEYCARYGLRMVPEVYYGKAGDLFDIPIDDNWNKVFLETLEKKYVNDSLCAHNNNEVYEEGVVIRLENDMSNFTALKLKNWGFFEHETKLLNAGESSMEEEN